MEKHSSTPVRKKKRRPGVGSRILFSVALTVVIVICATAAIYVGFHPPRHQAELAGKDADVNQITQPVQSEEEPEPEEPQKNLYDGPYPELVSESYETEKVAPETEKSKICYLTFDDGPSQNTVSILDTLKQYNAKATFFIVGSEIEGHEDIIKRMAEEGHTVAIHCNRHEYGDLYSSVDGFLKDFNTIYNRLYELTGQYPQCFRFPGGSNNAIAERHNTTQEIIDEMTARGFDYYDWNAYTGDAESGSSAARVYSKAVSEITGSARDEVILLAHDAAAKKDTANQLPKILEALKDQVEFLPITTTTKPIQFIKPTATIEREQAEEEQEQQSQQSADTPEDSESDTE